MSPVMRLRSVLDGVVGTLPASPHFSNRDLQQNSRIYDSTTIRQAASFPHILATEFASWPRSKRDMSPTKTVGLSMIPAGMFFFLILGGFLVWLQKRKKRQADTPPPVPEKDFPSRGAPASELVEGGRKRSSRVFNMAAFTTPIHGGRTREASVIGQSPEKRSAMQSPKRRTEAKAVRLVVPEEGEAEIDLPRDSPVDGGSPFVLKPDSGTKRLSLGTEISKNWPSPPPAVWIGTPEGGISPQPSPRTRIVPSRILTDTEAEIIGLYSRSWYLPADYETSR